MVLISEEEFKEYIYLKKKEEIRDKEIAKMMQEGVPKTKKWRRDLYSKRGYASYFALILGEEHAKRNYPDEFALDTWDEAKKYLTDKVLSREKGKIIIDRSFRRYMREYGWSLIVDRKYGLFIVKKFMK